MALSVALHLFGSPGSVRANGAFPDGEQMLFPRSHPDHMFVATNFGLVLSEDGGESWQWVCESPFILTALAHLYQLGAGMRVFAVSTAGLVHSDDAGCTWTPGGGLEGLIATDAFVDFRDPTRVFALAQTPQGIHTAYASDDSGETFGALLYTGRIDEVLTGIESATSDPQIVYLASYMLVGDGERVVRFQRSMDGGSSWESTALTDQLAGTMRIIQVDPEDPAHVFMRLTTPDLDDQLIVTEDGGATYRTLLDRPGSMRAFLRRSDGSYLATWEAAAIVEAFRSEDGGDSFEPWPLAIRARAFTERDGRLYALGSESFDGHALFVSGDDGATWEPVMRYADMTGPKACLVEHCGPACVEYADMKLWPVQICPAPPPEVESDAGAAVDAGAPRPRIPTANITPASGCGVSTAARRGFDAGHLLSGLLFALVAGRCRRSRPGRARRLSSMHPYGRV